MEKKKGFFKKIFEWIQDFLWILTGSAKLEREEEEEKERE